MNARAPASGYLGLISLNGPSCSRVYSVAPLLQSASLGKQDCSCKAGLYLLLRGGRKEKRLCNHLPGPAPAGLFLSRATLA